MDEATAATRLGVRLNEANRSGAYHSKHGKRRMTPYPGDIGHAKALAIKTDIGKVGRVSLMGFLTGIRADRQGSQTGGNDKDFLKKRTNLK